MKPLYFGMRRDGRLSSCWSAFKVTNHLPKGVDESAGDFLSFDHLCDSSISPYLYNMATLINFSPPGSVFCHFSFIFSFSHCFPRCSLPLCHLLFYHSLAILTYLFLTLIFCCVSSVCFSAVPALSIYEAKC